MRHREALAEIERLKGSALAERIKALGIELPDQDEARRMMDVARLGVAPNAAAEVVSRIHPIRRWFLLRTIKYEVYTVDAFSKVAKDHGGEMPARAAAEAERIKQAFPEVQLDVHALWDDPWLIAKEYDPSTGRMQEVIVRGWYRDREVAREVVATIIA